MPIPKPTRLKYDFIKKSKAKQQPNENGYVIKGAYNQPIPVNKDGFYKFKSSANGAIDFRISRMAKDYPSFGLAQQLSAYVNGYVLFSRLWLTAHGYSPVNIVFCNGYTQPGQYDFNDNQAQLRQRIMADYLCPSNYGKPMHLWRGIVQEKSEAQARGYSIDTNGSKG
jgi:hypothetical protein